MIKEAIEKILELNRETICEIDGREYSTVNLFPTHPMKCSAIVIHTLTGLVDWINNKNEPDPCFVWVANENTVFALGELQEKWRQREQFLKVELFSYNGFPFNEFIDIERFIIEVQSKFVETEIRNKLIKAVSSITGDLVVQADDDGAAQTVTVKDAIGRLNDTTMDPIISLRPYRTFREIEQPESRFLLRFKRNTGKLPWIALFEADGGEWKIEAIANIKHYLQQKKTGVEIIA